MFDPAQKPSPSTPVPQATQDNSIPVPIASPRSTGFQVGDELTMFGQTVKILGTRPDGSPIVASPSVKLSGNDVKPAGTPTKLITGVQPTTQPKQGMIKRGQWLRNRLNELYNDPMYKTGSPEVKQYYKERAYDRWVVPYYKHINTPVMSKNAFVTGVPDQESGLQAFFHYLTTSGQAREDRREHVLESAMSRTSKTLAGVSSLLNFVTKPIEDMLTPEGQPMSFNEAHNYMVSHPGASLTDAAVAHRNARLTISNALQTSENYYTKQAEGLDHMIQDRGGKDLTDHVTDLATQAVFFEALGGAKASELFKFANPKTAATAVKVAKTAWNGAVTGLFWNPTTGGKASDIPSDAALFAIGDVGLHTATAGFLKIFGKFFSSEMTNQVLEKAAQGLNTGQGVSVPKQTEFVKGGSQVNIKAAEAGFAKVLNESAQKISGDDTNGAFKRLNPKQQKALLLRLSLVAQQSKDFNLENADTQEVASQDIEEQEEKSANIAPGANKIQKQIDDTIRQAGLDPTQAKLGATLPHHQTNIDSPIQHISARIAWLSSRLKSHVREDLITSDVDAMREALKQERELLKEAKAKRELLKKSNLTAGSGTDPLSSKEIEAHQKAFEQARSEWQAAHPGQSYTSNMSIMSQIMKRAEEIRKTPQINVPPERRFIKRGQPVVTQTPSKTSAILDEMHRAEQVKLTGGK